MSLVRLGQDAVAKLNTHLVRRVLDLPLQAFEATDTSALLAVLTEDIVLIAGAMAGVPQLCINVPIVIACLGISAGSRRSSSAVWCFWPWR